MSINVPAAVVSIVAAFLLGGLWYSPLLFGAAWARWNGLQEADLSRDAARVFGGAIALEALMMVNLAAFLGPAPGLPFAVGASLAAGIGWVGLGMGVTYLFERRPLGLWAVDAGYHAVSFGIAGVVFGAWPA